MTDLELAHRMAWRYKKSSDPHHSDTYTFNESCLLQFAARIRQEEREAAAAWCDAFAHAIDNAGNRYIRSHDALTCAAAIRNRGESNAKS